MLLFTATLEGCSWVLLKLGYKRVVHGPFLELHRWDQLPQEITKGGRHGELAKVLLEWKKRFPVISTPRQVDVGLRDEPPLYTHLGINTEAPLFRGNFLVNTNLNDAFVLRGAISKKEKYRAQYITDQFGRRLTGTENRTKPESNIIFLGCSFTFGEGVGQKENFPYFIGENIKTARVYNMGIPGAHAGIILRQLNKKNIKFLEGIDPSLPTTVIFTFIDDHLRRIVGTSTQLTRGEGIYYNQPYFYLDNGELRYDNSFSERWTNLRWLYRFFGETKLAEVTSLELPTYTENDYEVHGKIMASMKEKFAEVFPKLQFVFAVYPANNYYISHLEPYLAQAKIPVLNYNHVQVWELLNGYATHETDSHPSAIGHDLYSQLLVHDLRNRGLIKP